MLLGGADRQNRRIDSLPGQPANFLPSEFGPAWGGFGGFAQSGHRI